MDSGAGEAGLGSIGATWELGYDAWPVRELRPTTFALGEGGALAPTPPAQTGEASYTPDPRARPAQTLPGQGEADAWKAQPPYAWRPVAAGKGLGFTTEPLAGDVVIAGPSSVDLMLRSTARDTDLQVTLSEVRPDGAETYVQSGWLRASHRKLGRGQHRGRPAADAPALRRGAPAPRTLDAGPGPGVPGRPRVPGRLADPPDDPGPGRRPPRWRFATIERGRTRNTIQLGGATPSKLVLPVVGGATAKGTPLPAPTALRGQPSRPFVPASNGG
jgi:hypothetical protein